MTPPTDPPKRPRGRPRKYDDPLERKRIYARRRTATLSAHAWEALVALDSQPPRLNEAREKVFELARVLDPKIQSLEAALAEREARLAEQEKALAEREERVKGLEEVVREQAEENCVARADASLAISIMQNTYDEMEWKAQALGRARQISLEAFVLLHALVQAVLALPGKPGKDAAAAVRALQDRLKSHGLNEIASAGTRVGPLAQDAEGRWNWDPHYWIRHGLDDVPLFATFLLALPSPLFQALGVERPLAKPVIQHEGCREDWPALERELREKLGAAGDDEKPA